MRNTLIFLILFVLTGCTNQQPEKTKHKGEFLPAFTLLLTDSSTHFNTASIKPGEPVALFYFGPHCPYSRAQMEEIINNMSSLKNIRFYLFTSYPFGEMKGFYKDYQLSKYSNIVTGVDIKNYFAKYFEAKGVPYMAIYGKDLRLHEAFIGNIYEKQIKEVAEE